MVCDGLVQVVGVLYRPQVLTDLLHLLSGASEGEGGGRVGESEEGLSLEGRGKGGEVTVSSTSPQRLILLGSNGLINV